MTNSRSELIFEGPELKCPDCGVWKGQYHFFLCEVYNEENKTRTPELEDD